MKQLALDVDRAEDQLAIEVDDRDKRDRKGDIDLNGDTIAVAEAA